MSPFFDTRGGERIQLILTILNHRQRYCLRSANLQRLGKLPSSPFMH